VQLDQHGWELQLGIGMAEINMAGVGISMSGCSISPVQLGVSMAEDTADLQGERKPAIAKCRSCMASAWTLVIPWHRA